MQLTRFSKIRRGCAAILTVFPGRANGRGPSQPRRSGAGAGRRGARMAGACALGLTMLASAPAQAPQRFIVTAYVFPRGRSLSAGEIDAGAVSRINYAFATVQDGRVGGVSAADAQNLAMLTGLRARNPSLAVLISVGGWLGSGGFSDAALTAQSRSEFAASAVELLRRYDLDGLDVDWEYPGLPGAGHAFRAEDAQNFTSLIEELRRRFDREKRPNDRRWLLTIAAGASDEYLSHVEMSEVQGYLDGVNLMAYDYTMPSGHGATGHNAPLFAEPGAPSRNAVDGSVRSFERAGVPARKILLGAALYGHAWGDVADRNHGLFQPGRSAGKDSIPYSAIEQEMLGHGFTRYWDEAASVPYLYNAGTREFVAYDDAESLGVKSDYVKAQQLGGMMLWEYLDDPSGALLHAIDRALMPARGAAP